MIDTLPTRLPVVAVITCSTPALALVVNETVAMPFAPVVLVALANEPPLVLPHVTICPDCNTGFPPASTSCAEIVTAVPAVGLEMFDDTT